MPGHVFERQPVEVEEGRGTLGLSLYRTNDTSSRSHKVEESIEKPTLDRGLTSSNDTTVKNRSNVKKKFTSFF